MNIRTNKVLLIYTGGTIGMGRNPETDALEPLDFNHLTAKLPEFLYLKTDVDIYQFNPPIDSSDMTPEMWAKLVRIIAEKYESYDGFVILHGTDTMAYTASALSFMLENLTKPVVLTGSQLPIDQLRTDGKENLLTAIELASQYKSDGTPMVPEVCIYFNGTLLRGNRSTKKTADGFNAFESFNYPHLCDVGVNLNFHESFILKPDFKRPMIPHTAMDTNVMVISLFPGIKENIVRQTLNVQGLKSIVMRTFGSGNAPHSDWFVELLHEAAENNVIIVNITQCIGGNVEMSRYDTGYQLQQAGVVSGYDSTVESAVAKLMFLQAKHEDTKTIRRLMTKPVAGEITV